MKRVFLIASAVLLSACSSMDVTSPYDGSASFAAGGNGPARYQTSTVSYHVLVLGAYHHDYTVITNPCNGALEITGGTAPSSGYYTTETVTGTLAAGVITYHSLYDGPFNTGYQYDGNFLVGGGALGGDYTGTVSINSSSETNYKNHGEYVSANPNKNDAAHSCIGMPITQ